MKLERLNTFTPIKPSVTGNIIWKTPREIYNKNGEFYDWEYYTGITSYNNPSIENPPIGYTLKPEPPFDSYTKGNVALDKIRNRRVLNLSGSINKPPIGLLYARYLLQIKMFKNGEGFIRKCFEADHINNKCSDDRIENLQLITEQENKDKWLAQKGKVFIVLVCPICKGKFSRPPAETQCNPFRKDRVSCCSKECLNTMQIIRDAVPLENTSKWLNQNQMIHVVRVFSNEKYVTPVTELVAYWPNKTMLSFNWILKDDTGKIVDFRELRFSPIEEKIKFIDECLNNGLSLREIGRRMQLPHGTVRRMLDRIEGENNSYHDMLNVKIERIKTYLMYNLPLYEMAEKENCATRTLGLFISANKDLIYTEGLTQVEKDRVLI